MANCGRMARQKVKIAMHECKSGTSRSSPSGMTVRSRNQAIAIGRAEAWRAGGKVPRRKESQGVTGVAADTVRND
jgi:hypothetical protein